MPTDAELIPRNFGFDLLRATEAAALTAGLWMGKGKPEEADRFATAAMLSTLNSLEMQGHMVVSELKRLEKEAGAKLSFALPNDGRLGTGRGTEIDVVFDAIDGRGLLSKGAASVVSVVAAAPIGTLWPLKISTHMEKLVVDAEVAPALVPECLDAPAAWTLALVARTKRKKISDLTVFVLDRPRHEDLVHDIREAGARVVIRSAGDVAGALMACLGKNGVDVLMGIGGAVEGLVAACAVRAVGGGMLGRLAPLNATERQLVEEAGLDRKRIMTEKEMVTSSSVFFVTTGITGGPILDGVVYDGTRATTDSLILRGETQTRRRIFAEHLLTNP